MRLRLLAFCLVASIFATDLSAQQQLTREQILNMSIEELSELPLEDLMAAVETLGVSSVDELFSLIMNKNVSSASKKEEDSFKSPLSSTVITRDEMRTYGITTIEEAFRLIPGMIVTEKTNGIYDIQMRGLNNIPDDNMFLYTENANTLMMIDGRPVHNVAMGSVNFDALSIGIEDIDRIEVVRGACSALYGSNAVNGVINIITNRPTKDSDIVSGNIQMGSQNTQIGEVAIRKSFSDKFAAGVTFNLQHRDRPTDKLWLIPADGLYMADDVTNLTLGSLQTTPYSYYSYDENGNPTGLSVYLYDGQLHSYTEDQVNAAATSFQTNFSHLTDVSNGGWFSASELERMIQIYPVSYAANGQLATYRLFSAIEPETPVTKMIPHPELARKTLGFNAYLNFTPAEDVNIYVSGGYQNSEINTTPSGDEIFSFNTRTSKTFYASVDASIKDLHLMLSDNGGSQNYAYYVPGFKFDTNIFNVSAEYDFNLDCGLTIRPGFNYMRAQYKDRAPEWTDKDNYQWEYKSSDYRYADPDNYDNLSGFLMYDCTINTIAPSLRLDYRAGDFRVIGAFREDKTNIPDQWTPSWQFAASYSINDNNFVRVVYGRANRGANMVNTGADYTWSRTNMCYPSKLKFSSNPDADLMKIDNIEVGYRWKPANNILIDAEAFYSMSENYGALMADYGAMNVTQEGMQSVLYALNYGVADLDAKLAQYGLTARQALKDPDLVGVSISNIMSTNDVGNLLKPFASVKYSELPYEVKQMGISLNVDYIISAKLIAKLNANIQKTTIDKYFAYNQTEDITKMLTAATSATMANDAQNPLIPYTSPLNGSTTYRYNLSGELYEMFLKIADYYANGMSVEEASATVMSEFNAVKNGAYELGLTPAPDYSSSMVNGHKHEATPSFYGMLGLIYKPVQKLEVSAFANYIGKRTYLTKYGSDDLGQRFTLNMKVGYKPISGIEVFFNAHNLLNNKKREFTHCDEIGGIYTFGLNFAL